MGPSQREQMACVMQGWGGCGPSPPRHRLKYGPWSNDVEGCGSGEEWSSFLLVAWFSEEGI